MRFFATKSTSDNTLKTTPIILRENSVTRLVFFPLIIKDNPKNAAADIKGTFVFQRKSPKGAWEDISDATLANLKKDEGYKLDLHPNEVLALFAELEEIKKLYAQYGFAFGSRIQILDESNASGMFVQIADSANKHLVIEALKKLEKTNFENIQSILGVAKIDQILNQWRSNQTNPDEAFWQSVFIDNAWILQQVFSYPVIILQGETYVGGKNTKGRNGQGGVATDFLGINLSTDSFAVVEIKTPTTKLIGEIYRGDKGSGHANESYSASGDLSGAMVQLANQIHTAVQNFTTTLGRDFQERSIGHMNPNGVLVIGTLSSLTEAEKKSFNLFRKAAKDLTILTFDELFQKIESFRNILNG